MCYVPHNRRTISFLSFNISFLLLLKFYTFSKEFQITCKYCVRDYLYHIISTVWLLFCSLAVWTNSMLWSTTTQTLTSTWWRTWAAWTGWVSLFLGPTCFSFTEGKNKRCFKALVSTIPAAENASLFSRDRGTVTVLSLEFPGCQDPFLFSLFVRQPVAFSFYSSVATSLHRYPAKNPKLCLGSNCSLFSLSISLGPGNQTNRSVAVWICNRNQMLNINIKTTSTDC